MAKRPDPRRLRNALTYTVAELASTVGVTEVTVRAWLKQGLPVFTAHRPALIMGDAAKEFLIARRTAKKQSLAPDELFCFLCNPPRRAFGSMIEISAHPGKPIRIEGFCVECETTCHRVVSRAQLAELHLHFDIAANSAGAA